MFNWLQTIASDKVNIGSKVYLMHQFCPSTSCSEGKIDSLNPVLSQCLAGLWKKASGRLVSKKNVVIVGYVTENHK